MFGDRSRVYDRISDAISDIGARIAELEEQVVERVHPAPSRIERAGRAIAASLPGRIPPSGWSRYVPEFMSGWSLPSADEARGALSRLGGSVAELTPSYSGLKRSLSDLRASLPEVRLPRAAKLRRSDAEKALDYFRARPGLSTVLIAGGTIALVGGAYYVTRKVAAHTEEPDYDVVRQDGDVEIRDYDAMVVAETVRTGYHEKARETGFRALADYIFAHNRSGKKIAMTAPVLQQLAEGEGQTKGWAIRFVMPKKFTRSSLPVPATDDVVLKDVASKRIVAIRFSGNFNATLASKKLMVLYNYLADQNLKQRGDPEYAFYNPPWTPGFLKRNEIFIEIER